MLNLSGINVNPISLINIAEETLTQYPPKKGRSSKNDVIANTFSNFFDSIVKSINFFK